MKLVIRLLPFAPFLPMVAFAQSVSLTWFENLLLDITNFINSYLVPFIFAIAFLLFIWGVFKYFIYGATDEEARNSGKQFMIWALLGFVIMISVWGLVNLVDNIFNLSGGTAPSFPTI